MDTTNNNIIYGQICNTSDLLLIQHHYDNDIVFKKYATCNLWIHGQLNKNNDVCKWAKQHRCYFCKNMLGMIEQKSYKLWDKHIITMATICDSYDMVQYAYNNGCDIVLGALVYAIGTNNWNIIEFIINKKHRYWRNKLGYDYLTYYFKWNLYDFIKLNIVTQEQINNVSYNSIMAHSYESYLFFSECNFPYDKRIKNKNMEYHVNIAIDKWIHNNF